jgi:hypothetical protein
MLEIKSENAGHYKEEGFEVRGFVHSFEPRSFTAERTLGTCIPAAPQWTVDQIHRQGSTFDYNGSWGAFARISIPTICCSLSNAY